MKTKKSYAHIFFLGFLISYTVIYRLFQKFAIGFFPEALLIVYAFLLGLEVRLLELLIISIFSSIFSFAFLQILSLIFFKHFITFNILLTAIAKGSTIFGISSVLIVITVGLISNLAFNKKKGS